MKPLLSKSYRRPFLEPEPDPLYSIKVLLRSANCASCGTTVAPGYRGHYYSAPLCDTCFPEAAPDVHALLARAKAATEPFTVQALRSPTTCSQCGAEVAGRFAGCSTGQPLCRDCLRLHSPALALLLQLDHWANHEKISTASGNQFRKIFHRYLESHERLGKLSYEGREGGEVR